MFEKIVDRQKGALFGLAIGDAMGAPYEFMKQGFEVNKEYIEGGWLNVTKGEWTDDTSMALCLSNSLIAKKSFDGKDQIEKYYRWFKTGYMSTRNHCFDIGNTTRAAITKNHFIQDLDSVLKVDENSNNYANGALMRFAPIPIVFWNKSTLSKYAKMSALTTHTSKICIETNIIFGKIMSNLIKGCSKEQMLSNIDFNSFDEKIIERIDKSQYKTNTLPTGNVLDCLEISLYALQNFDTFIDGLLYVISLGEDTDTIGAIYGQLAGSYYGLSGIPEYYIDNLQLSPLINTLANELIKLNNEI